MQNSNTFVSLELNTQVSTNSSWKRINYFKILKLSESNKSIDTQETQEYLYIIYIIFICIYNCYAKLSCTELHAICLYSAVKGIYSLETSGG